LEWQKYCPKRKKRERMMASDEQVLKLLRSKTLEEIKKQNPFIFQVGMVVAEKVKKEKQ
jgi:hypothetical protein